MLILKTVQKGGKREDPVKINEYIRVLKYQVVLYDTIYSYCGQCLYFKITANIN